MSKEAKLTKILSLLKEEYPQAKTALNFNNPFELLVATILSAQTTDVLVNRVTEKLFKKYRTVSDFAQASSEELQKELVSINFYKTKAKNIKECANIIKEKYNSLVPKSMEELIKLPGVARKTANIILYNAFGINEGIAVDTHVKRLSKRLGLTQNEDPQKIEADLMSITPKEEWGVLSHLLILHGRKVCQAKKPKHHECIIKDLCPSNEI